MKSYAKTPTILQMEVTECGAASLCMVMAYHGRYVPLEQMRIETAVSRDGVNAGDMLRAAVRFGLECHGYRKETEDLKQMDMPCIIHWNFNHFVVLEGFKGKNVYLNDPGVGRRKMSFEELDLGFTGVVLTFKKTNEFKREKKKGNLVPFIHSRLKGQTLPLLQLFYIGLLLVVPGLVLPVLSQVFIDDILMAGYRDWLVRFLLFMGACLLLKELLSYYRALVLEKLKGKMVLISGYRFLTHMLKLPIAFFDQRYPGDLVNRMENNKDVNEFLAGNFAETILNVFTAIFYLVILLFYSPILTGIGIISIIISVLVAVFGNRVLANAMHKLQMSYGKLYGSICAGLNITDTIKASGIEMEYGNRLMGFHAIYATQEQKMKRFQSIINVIPEATGKIIDVLFLMIGAVMVIQGSFTTGMLIAFNSLFDSFADPVNKLLSFFEGLQTVKSNVHRVDDIQRYPQDQADESRIIKSLEGYKLSGRVELQNISFGYAIQKPPVVKNFNFRLRTGESIAFVGPSGCGKSTISKVVSGLYKPWSGHVLFDGYPIEQIPPSVLHASISTVSQNIMLFSGTVRDNISMWNKAIPEEDIIAAAKDACIDDFIVSQPGGYDYLLAENAANLSGGQRQRIEIARALAINPTILIMDEATSALDPIVEKKILDNIHRRGCTCVMVAHRLSAIRDCNEIVVMKSGEIIQRGTHEEMKHTDGFYQQFIRDI